MGWDHRLHIKRLRRHDWEWLLIGWAHVSAGPCNHGSVPWSLLCKHGSKCGWWSSSYLGYFSFIPRWWEEGETRHSSLCPVYGSTMWCNVSPQAALLNVAYTVFLKIIVGKPTIVSKAQDDFFVWALMTLAALVMGGWKRIDNKDHVLEQLCILQNFNQTTQSVACWEKAYPHCSLGKCQLVLKTSKQSLLPSAPLSPSPHCVVI